MPLITTNWVESAPTSLCQARFVEGEEVRIDDIHDLTVPTYGDLYHGRAPDHSSTADPVWEVVRFYRDTDAFILRVRYTKNIAWDDRTNPANWP